jgi:hypothetical protein
MLTDVRPSLNGPTSKQLLAAGLLITLLAAGIRFTNLGYDSLWFDEIMTRHAVVQGPASAAAAPDMRDHLPLLYTLVQGSLRLWPEHELTLRLPSAIAGILAVPLLIAFGRLVGLPAAGLWAALLLALSPFHLHHSQEARHYALLLFFALLSLYWLYRAIAHGGWRSWLIFGLATGINLLTHYSAWLLLAAEGLLIGGWAIATARKQGWQSLFSAFPGLVVIGMFLLAILPRARAAFEANSGPAAAYGTTAAASLTVWLHEIWLAFGFSIPASAFILCIFSLLGVVYLTRTRRWLLLAFLGTTAVVPITLIQLFHVARWALPKYLIYLLPLYLLCAGIAIQLLAQIVSDFLPWPRPARARHTAVLATFALTLLLAAWQPLQTEYLDMVRDWRGATTGLGPATGPNDAILTLALDTADGYNAAGVAAPYYLDPSYRVLDGNHLELKRVTDLVGQDGDVAAILLSAYRPIELDETIWQVTPYKHGLYTIQARNPKTSSLNQLSALYEALLPFAETPAPRCALEQKLALLYVGQGAYDRAQTTLTAVDPNCPLGQSEHRRLQALIDEHLLTQAVSDGDEAQVHELALSMLARDPDDQQALAALTLVNLLQIFAEGTAVVTDNLAPEPTGIRQFTLPNDGAVEVLFMHPPAQASFVLTLPESPVALHTRTAFAPESGNWGGDGVTFVVTIEPEGRSGEELYRQHMANSSDERNRQMVEISLADYAGQKVILTLATENGPTGDGTGDWAGWETPHILFVSP